MASRNAGIVSMLAAYAALTLGSGYPISAMGKPEPEKPAPLLPEKEKSLEDTVAVMVFAATEGRQDIEKPLDLDPIDKNLGWISMVRSYNALREQGVPAKNIFILYGDGTMNRSEDKSADIGALAKRFYDEDKDHPALRKATKEEFLDLMGKLQKEVDDNDSMILYLDGHGSEDGSFWFEYGTGNHAGPMNEKTMAEQIKKVKAKNLLLVTEQCYGGAWTDGKPEHGKGTAIVAGAPADKLHWNDREWSLGAYLLMAFNNKDNDTDKDGAVEYSEALEATKTRGKARHEELKTFLFDPAKYKLPPADRAWPEYAYHLMRNEMSIDPRSQEKDFPQEWRPGQGYEKK